MIFANTKHRISQFIDYKCIDRKIFFEKTGIKRGFLDSDKLESTVSDESIAKIIAAFPDLNLEWLITGRGNMYNDDKKTTSISPNSLEGVPLIPIDAMAGYGTGEIAVMDYDIKELYQVPDFKGVDFMIRVKGSSMIPKYNSGDVVACKKLGLDDIFFQWNKVYVLDTDQGALIKRIKKGKDDEHLLIVSDNAAYDPFELPIGHIHAIALVVGVIRLE